LDYKFTVFSSKLIDDQILLLPGWIPGHFFWTYVTGAALIGSGTAIVLKIKLKLASLLLSLMIFLWFILLHIPGAIADPVVDHGNLVVSAAGALGFSGTALMKISAHQFQAQLSKTWRCKSF
jgi:hypothetical protein